MSNPFDPLGVFDAAERDARRMNRAVELGVKVPGMAYRPQLRVLPSWPGARERTTPTPPMSSESLWGLTRAQLDTFAPQIADDWERRDMIPKGTRLTVASYLREMARRMYGTSPPY